MIEKEWWNKRYRDGFDSGRGSKGQLRRWKWKTILSRVESLTSVIDVGCGDLIFWKLPLNRMRKCEKYIGIDQSDVIIKRNRKKYPHRKFINASSDKTLNVKGDIVLCMDLLFHIMDDNSFEKTLENLCHYSNKWIFINTWIKNPLNEKTDGIFQYYRPLQDYFHIFTKKGFNLTASQKYPYDEFNAIYIFTKVP